MRKGTLTDQQTLALYRRGESLITLAIHEKMSVLSIATRLTRARRARDEVGIKRPPTPLPPIDGLAELERQLRHMTRTLKSLRVT